MTTAILSRVARCVPMRVDAREDGCMEHVIVCDRAMAHLDAVANSANPAADAILPPFCRVKIDAECCYCCYPMWTGLQYNADS
jgi:hypothetical protein